MLDVPLGLIALAAFIPILLATRWFQHRSRRIYRRTRSAIAVGDRAVHRDDERPARGAVVPPGGAQPRRSSRRFNEENARANGDGLVALAIYTPLVRLFGNLSLVATMVVGADRR